MKPKSRKNPGALRELLQPARDTPGEPSWVNRPGRRPPQLILESVKGQATQVVSHG